MFNFAIFASGNGSNALSIINYFEGQQNGTVSIIICNKQGAGVIDVAKEKNIKYAVLDKNEFHSGTVVNLLASNNISMVILAGFLLKISPQLIKLYPNKIINLHPSLLPKYGGKGMYGMHVHQAVIDNKEHESGISIHFVNENYDQGDIVFQAKTTLDPLETVSTLAKKIQKLEHKYYPQIIQKLISDNERI